MNCSYSEINKQRIKIKPPSVFLSTLAFLLTLTLAQQGNAQEDRFAEDYKQLRHHEVIKYANQLTKDGNVPYATLRSLPLPREGANPFVLEKINETELENLPLFTLSGFRDIHQASAKLKIPSGTHNLLIRGGGWRKVIKTSLKSVKLEPGQDYLIVYEPAEQSVRLRIHKYSIDPRFSPFDKDHYIIGEPISEPTLLGEQKN